LGETDFDFLIFWCSAAKADANANVALASAKLNPQANLAIEILIALYDDERGVDEKKVLLKILGGLKLKVNLGDERSTDLKTVKKMDILLRFLDEVRFWFN